MTKRAIWVFSLLMLAVSAGCKPKVGDSCEAGKSACADEKNELACQGGKFIQAPCKGPKGCAVEGSTLTCDISANAAGDVCSTGDDGHAMCGTDKKSIVICKGGKYIVESCLGPEGCKSDGGKSTCDSSIAKPGESCQGDTHACSVDKKTSMQCKGGKYVKKSDCKRCTPFLDHIDCN